MIIKFKNILLSVIIVNYNSYKLIVDCINSALQFESSNFFEWIIVDNNSNDNSEQILTNKFPFIKWFQMGYNAGFARANNVGIKQSKGDVVLLLNPDTIILNNCIENCYNEFVNSINIACGVQLLNEDLSNQASGHYFMKGGINHLLPLPYWGKVLKIVATILKVKKPSINNISSIQNVDWISGAFLMVKKSSIDKIGLMDEDFFLYAEEVEWCSRLKKIGNLCIYGSYHIIHLIGETIKKESKTNEDKSYENLYDKKGLQLIVSNHLRIRKQYGIFWFIFQLFNFTLTVPIFFIFNILKNIIKFQNPFNEFWKVKGFSKNVFRLWQLTPTILKGKPFFYKMI